MSRIPVTELSSWDFRAGGTTEVLSFMRFLSTRRCSRAPSEGALRGEDLWERDLRPQADALRLRHPAARAQRRLGNSRSQCGPDDPDAVRGGRAAPGPAQPDDGGELVATQGIRVPGFVVERGERQHVRTQLHAQLARVLG